MENLQSLLIVALFFGGGKIMLMDRARSPTSWWFTDRVSVSGKHGLSPVQTLGLMLVVASFVLAFFVPGWWKDDPEF